MAETDDLAVEAWIQAARLAFPDAQAALEGLGTRFGLTRYELAWYGTSLHEWRGSFCIVNETGPLADLVGDVLRFSYGLGMANSVFAYCLSADDLDYDVAITRRCFAALESLSVEAIDVRVEVVE